MGRKRKVVEHIAVAKEDKTSNAYSEKTSTQEKLYFHTDNSNVMGDVNDENYLKQTSNGVGLLEKDSRVRNAVVRRSKRLKSLVSPAGSLGAKPVVEHVNLVENEMEEAVHPQEQEVNDLRDKNTERERQADHFTTLPEVNGRSLEENVDYLVRAVDEFKSKAVGQVFRRSNEGPSPDISYKSLYIESQKKIEALMEDNFDLVRKLEFARGKIAAYEVMKDAMVASKEAILFSTLGKSTEATANLLSKR